MQLSLPLQNEYRIVKPFKYQLLKWIGNKQRFAHEIISHFPLQINRYIEPFLGSGAVLGTFAYDKSIGSDIFKPLMEIWQMLHSDPETLKRWYEVRWLAFTRGNKTEKYEKIRNSYNSNPNGADLLFLCRSCYGGVVRFRSTDGYMSTPCGVHDPISPKSFAYRVDEWYKRTSRTSYLNFHYEEVLDNVKKGDMIYCDPPYRHSQTILYGGQEFNLEHLLTIIEKCKTKGAYVALSIDGTKRSGELLCELPIPAGLFNRELFVNCGRSMLKRFQMEGRSLKNEVVADRLLLTY
jgi:DNA adenine methylase